MTETTTGEESVEALESTGIATSETLAVLDEELIESLWIEQIFGDEALEQLADDWCRTQHTVAEIAERQRLAGVVVAPVVQLPIPASQIRSPRSLRGAA